jgi:hypothetical protein
MEVFFAHLILGIVLFFIINWIGKHSYSIGYIEISIFVKTEEAPALNFLIRVLSPIVYLIIISAILYYFGLDRFVINIYLVNIYYVIFRLLFNLLTNRGRLLNWYRQFIYWAAIIIISYLAYIKLICVKSNILPDFTTLANELWIIILIFIFQVTNNIRLSKTATEKRKFNYIKSRYFNLKNLYDSIIKESTKNQILEALIYAIMIYEDFNRPKIVRFIENILFRISKKPRTLGIMQVKTDKFISDKESVMLGVNKVLEAHAAYLKKVNNFPEEYYEWSACNFIASNYNGGTSYSTEINRLFTIIKENFYKDTTDSLRPIIKNGL